MDHPLIELINACIQEAEAAGAFDSLEGACKPLPPENDPQNALLNRLARENGAVPEIVTLSRALAKLREGLAAARPDPSARHPQGDVFDGRPERHRLQTLDTLGPLTPAGGLRLVWAVLWRGVTLSTKCCRFRDLAPISNP